MGVKNVKFAVEVNDQANAPDVITVYISEDGGRRQLVGHLQVDGFAKTLLLDILNLGAKETAERWSMSNPLLRLQQWGSPAANDIGA